MAEFASLPLFTDAISSDCAHLSNEEFGIYMRLLILMWRTPGASVPDDDGWIARKMRMQPSEWLEKGRPIVDEFCICFADALHEQRISQKRLLKEFEHVRTSVAKRKAAAAKRWAAEKVEEKPVQSIVIADAPTPTPTPTPSLKKQPPSSVVGDTKNLKEKPAKRAAKLPDDFSPDLQPAIDEGLQPQEAILSLARFKDHAAANGRTQIDWMAAWRLWYRGDIQKKQQGRSSRAQAPPGRTIFDALDDDAKREMEARNGTTIDLPAIRR